jgi:signal transduction histidine kinase
LGGIGGSLGFVFVASTLLALVDARRQDERAGLVLWAFVANTLAVCHDAMIQSASLRSVYLSEHAALLTMWAVSLILLDRLARASEELDLRTRQLSSSVGELKHTEAELVKKEQLAAVGALSGLIAHQVETPLATIQHATSNLGRADLDAAERLELLALLDEEVERLNRLVNDLLAYARPVKRQVRPITIAEVVSECLGRSVREDDGIAVEVSLDGAPTTLYADSDLLRSALDNIVENAVQAMPGGGRIAVRASDDVLDGEPAVVLEIEDDGPGMDEETYDRSREPFFTTRSLGTGLGLAIVDRVIKMHGGELVVESALGRGTKVSIRLPLGEPTASITPSDERGRKMLGDGHAQ